MNKLSSDEKLLRIIEGASASSQKLSENPVLAKAVKKFNGFNLKSIKEALAQLDFNKLSALSLPSLNKFLIAFAGVLTIVIIYVALSGWRGFNPNLLFLSPQEAAGISKTVLKELDPSLMQDNYAKAQLGRNIFLPFASRAASSAFLEEAEAKEILKNIKLVGIIWSSNPEVMIEDAGGRTYSLKKGEFFDQGQIKIKNIDRNSALLEVITDEGARDYILR